MIEFISYSYSIEEESVTIPEHQLGDLIILYRASTRPTLIEGIRGWVNRNFEGSAINPYQVSWVIDQTGLMSSIPVDGHFSCVLVFRGCNVGNIGAYDANSSVPITKQSDGGVMVSKCPELPTTPDGPSRFLFITSATDGLPSVFTYPLQEINDIEEVYIDGSSTKAVHQTDGRNALIGLSTETMQCPSTLVTFLPFPRGFLNTTIELIQSSYTEINEGGVIKVKVEPSISHTQSEITSCAGNVSLIGDTILSNSDFENAQDLISAVGGDLADPTADEYESYIAAGNNDRGVTGIQPTLPTQTSPPTPSPYKPKTEITSDPVERLPIANTGSQVWTPGDYDVAISQNFILRDVTIGYADKSINAVRGCYFPNKLTDLPSISAQERFNNLRALAENVLEPLYSRFGRFRINSAIRNQNSVSNGISQHVLGQAVDIQFPTWNYDMYWNNATWVKDNLPYDQFIFEHSNRPGSVWLHLSFNRSGNRPASNPRKVMTMYRGHYDSGLKKYY